MAGTILTIQDGQDKSSNQNIDTYILQVTILHTHMYCIYKDIGDYCQELLTLPTLARLSAKLDTIVISMTRLSSDLK